MNNKQEELLIQTLTSMFKYGVKCKSNIKSPIIAYCTIDGINIAIDGSIFFTLTDRDKDGNKLTTTDISDLNFVKPYLRPISSMTEEERKELDNIAYGAFEMTPNAVEVWSREFIVNEGTIVNPFLRPYKQTRLVSSTSCYQLINWLNAHHFDYACLIPKGLALKAPKGMYN